MKEADNFQAAIKIRKRCFQKKISASLTKMVLDLFNLILNRPKLINKGQFTYLEGFKSN